MNSLPNVIKVLNKYNCLTLSTAVLFSVISSSALANRPAMDAPAEVMTEPTEEVSTEAPSSVDIMMQQQTQQTGDVMHLPAKEMQAGETLQIKLLDSPRRGMSMNTVRKEYGQPVAVSDSVGEPPITRWTYQDRVVYFEHSSVLHVVAR